MVDTLLIGGIIALVAATIAALLALRIQQGRLNRQQAQQQAWERAQEMQQQQWKVLQEKRAGEIEKKLTTQVQQVRSDWRAWEAKDRGRMEQFERQHIYAMTQAYIEHELGQLPSVEDVPLNAQEKRRQRLTRLQEADLSGRDLSRRYLGYADLRGANLSHANLFMSDLFGASLTDANLSSANLSGANLAHADLRGANLTNANLLVSDLNSTSLMGANLRGIHSLAPEQLAVALYDNTTQFDDEIDITLPLLPSIRKPLPATPSPIQLPPTTEHTEHMEHMEHMEPMPLPTISEPEAQLNGATPLPPHLDIIHDTPQQIQQNGSLQINHMLHGYNPANW